MEINTFSHLKTSRRLARMQPFSYLGMQFADVKRIFLKHYANTLTSGLVAQESSENPLCRDSKQLQVVEKTMQSFTSGSRALRPPQKVTNHLAK